MTDRILILLDLSSFTISLVGNLFFVFHLRSCRLSLRQIQVTYHFYLLIKV